MIYIMNTYAFMAQKLAVIVFLQILMWALPKTSLKIYSERKSLPNSGCYKSKKVSMFITFCIIYIFVLNADVSNRGDIYWYVDCG